MGQGHFQNADKANPRGYFEDLRWRHANQRITGNGYSIAAANVERIGKKQRAIYRQLAREYKAKRIWGIKDPWLCFVGQFVWCILENQGIEVYGIAVHRDFDASVSSIRRHIMCSYRGKYRHTPREIAEAWQAGFERRLGEFPRQDKLYHIHYERLVNSPKVEIMRLTQFCYENLLFKWTGNVDEVTAWISPKLKHF